MFGLGRVEVTASSPDIHNPKGFMVSAYVNEHTQQAVTVMGNNNFSDGSFQLNTKDRLIETWQPYITSGNPDDKLKPLSPVSGTEIIIPKQSIVTLPGTWK